MGPCGSHSRAVGRVPFLYRIFQASISALAHRVQPSDEGKMSWHLNAIAPKSWLIIYWDTLGHFGLGDRLLKPVTCRFLFCRVVVHTVVCACRSALPQTEHNGSFKSRETKERSTGATESKGRRAWCPPRSVINPTLQCKRSVPFFQLSCVLMDQISPGSQEMKNHKTNKQEQ